MWDWFDKTATLLGFISLIPIFWTWYLDFGHFSAWP